jgi:hypothetical protein
MSASDMQPIFAIKHSKVIEIIQHQAKSTPIAYPITYSLEWGEIQSEQQLLDAVASIEKDGEYIRMHKLHECFQQIETHKLIAYANRMLKRVLALCKECREDISYTNT